MSAGAWTLIVPTRLETDLTGFIGAAERSHRGATWRADVRAGQAAALSKDGVAVAWSEAPEHARRLGNDAVQFFTKAAALRG
jgi:hypothetical protein